MWDNEVWCLEVSNEDFDSFLFVNQHMVLIDKEGDEGEILEVA